MRMFSQVRRLLAGLLLTGCVAGLSLAEPIRSQEINQCLPGEVMTWADGRDRAAIGPQIAFTYSHDDAPPWFSEALVAGMVEKAADAWSQCGVQGYRVDWKLAGREKWLVVVQWSVKESRGNFALADLGTRILSINPDMFQVLKTRNPKHDARETLQMAISHEMGHFFGLMAHSRRCVDVLSYYHNGKGESCVSRDPAWKKVMVEYRHIFPTACDIERCRAANKKPPLPGGRLNR